MVLVAILMGSHHVAARVALDSGANVFAILIVRSIPTAFIVGLLLVAYRTTWRFTIRQCFIMLLIGFLVWLQSALVYTSTAKIPVALALLAFNTYPLWTALIAWLFYKRRPPRSIFFMMPVILFGLALTVNAPSLISGQERPHHWNVLGIGMLQSLLAGAIFGVVLSMTQFEVALIDGRIRTLLIMIVVAVLSVCIAQAQSGFSWPSQAIGWGALVLMVTLFGIGFTTLFTVLPKMGVVGNSPIMNIEPVATFAIAWLVLDQRMEPLQIAGGLIVTVTVLVYGYASIPR